MGARQYRCRAEQQALAFFRRLIECPAVMYPKLPESRIRRDAVRLGLQSAVAAASAWLLVSTFLPPHASWAVISAVFVVSQSAGGTIKAASGRALGTIAGTMIGVICVWLIGGGANTALRVALAAGAASAMATFKPRWRFGIVAAVIVALEQNTTILEGALNRSLAILAGTGAGVAAAFLVWRESAMRRTEQALSQALAGCRDLLKIELEAVTGEKKDFQPAHQDVAENLRRAREEASALSSTDGRQMLHERVHAVQRLWHALIMIDRAASEDWSITKIDASALRQAVGRVRDAAAERLAELGTSEKAEPPVEKSELHTAVSAASRVASPASLSDDAVREKIALGGLAFALVELERNIRELEDLRERRNAGA